MTMKLSYILPFASGFAVEPQELMSIFECFGGILPASNRGVAKEGIEIFQIETRNPHLHEERGGMHLRRMILPVLSVIYYSTLCNSEIRQQISEKLIEQGALQPEGEIPRPEGEIPRPHLIPPPKTINAQIFANFMKEHLPMYSVLER
jgi:mannosyl-3-phosphoglycerate synthase